MPTLMTGALPSTYPPPATYSSTSAQPRFAMSWDTNARSELPLRTVANRYRVLTKPGFRRDSPFRSAPSRARLASTGPAS